MFTSARRIIVGDFELKKNFFEMTKLFEFESMSLFEINFIIDMLGKLEKLGQGFLKKYAVKL